MYNLIKLTADFDDSFVFFLIAKDINKTFNYLASQINSKNVNNPLFKFLVTNRKKLYDLNREIVFSSVKLDEVEAEKRKLENKKIQPPIEVKIVVSEDKPVVESTKEEVIKQPDIVEVIKPKQKRNYTKKIKSDEINDSIDNNPINNISTNIEEKLIESTEEIIQSPTDSETQTAVETKPDVVVKEDSETPETPVQ